MLASYWGFLLMSLHLGQHWSMIMGVLRNAAKIRRPLKARTWTLRVLAIILSIYGICAFAKNDIVSYLFLQTHFVFIDADQTLISFLVEYLGMMGMWAVLSYYTGKLLRRFGTKQAEYSTTINDLS